MIDYVVPTGRNANQLRWKKYVTSVQLVQFVIMGIHGSRLLFDRSCNYPRAVSGLEVFESAFFFYHFSKFYKRNYIDTGSKTKDL